MMKNRSTFGFALLVASFITASVSGDVIIVSSGTTTTIDFESTLAGSNNGIFTGAGFTAGATGAGQLDSNSWSIDGFGNDVVFGADVTSGDAARGTDSDSVSTGGFYAFDASADGGSVGVGVQPAGSDFTPGDITLRLRNSTGSQVTSFDVGYALRVYNDQDRANSFNFQYSFDDANYTDVSALDFTSQASRSGAPSWELSSKSSTIDGLNLADGGNLYFRWVGGDVSGGGSRDQFQLDDISITFNAASVPEPTSMAMFAVAVASIGFRRRRRR